MKSLEHFQTPFERTQLVSQVVRRRDEVSFTAFLPRYMYEKSRHERQKESILTQSELF